ncbi:MAG: Gfo/Idh/MocA family oxidoreductase, partial [Armatimonadota bacterium]
MYNVGVIGLGWIAEGYGSPEDPNSYCHVGGILPSDRVRLAAVADLDAAKRESFQTKWGAAFPEVKYYDTSAGLLDSGECDIIAVCVRGPHHFSVMQDVIAAGPKAIFLEKPPTCSLAEMDAMVAAAQAKSIPITVSYSRHWAPHVLRLQELVQSGFIGEVQMVVGYTGHSFLSFASHTTDLICQFSGY